MLKSGLLLNAEFDHRRLMDIARLAEELNYDNLWYADERFYRETYTGLAACALATSRMGLGTAVTDPYTRHPALTAAAIASLDELSAGRAILGYAAGAAGFRNLGLRPERSVVALREGIHVIRELLAGKRVTYEGEMISIWEAEMKFETRADIPIYLAAWGNLNMQLAGEIADGVIIPHCASPLILAEHLERLEAGMDRVKREQAPEIVVRIDASVSRDREAALRAIKIRLGRYLWAQYPHIRYLELHNLNLPAALEKQLRNAGPFPGGHDEKHFEPFVDVIPDELVYPIAFAGTPEEVVEQARKTIEAGAEEIMVYLLVPKGETIESVVRIYADEVVTRLR